MTIAVAISPAAKVKTYFLETYLTPLYKIPILFYNDLIYCTLQESSLSRKEYILALHKDFFISSAALQ
jgi:hypothetical protein